MPEHKIEKRPTIPLVFAEDSMSINTNSPDLITQQAISDTKIAAATDRHQGQLRHEVTLSSDNTVKAAWEQNLREGANMEIGRARNITRVV